MEGVLTVLWLEGGVEELEGGQIRGVQSVTSLPLLLVLGGSDWPAVGLVTDGPDTRGASCPGLASDHSFCALGTGLGCLLV